MLTSLRRETLSDQVARSLLDSIENRRVRPGESLPSEAQLAATFGVSRPIVREALRVLEATGVIDVANGKGATVKPLTGELLTSFFRRAARLREGTLIELLEVRKGIEVQSAILAAQRREPADLREMKRLVAEMRRQLQDSERYTKLDAQLHLAIAHASGNTVLRHLVESIRAPLEDTIRAGLQRRITGEQHERVQILHEELVAAIEVGEADAAGRAMAVHFDEAVMAMVEDQVPRHAFVVGKTGAFPNDGSAVADR
jgi:GntR family transcriptional regulator, transcriptional repressor for pyruvate dehydrogenase complex